MTRHLRTFGLAVALALGTSSFVWAQTQAEKDAAQAEAVRKAEALQQSAEAIRRAEERRRLVPLSIDVVVSRYQGEKKISSLPYLLAVNANDQSPSGVCNLRMGAKVPVPTIIAPKANAGGQPAPMTGPVNYQDIGTNIDCSARSEEGGFQLRLTVEDTSVYTNIQDGTTPTVDQMPVFRTFRSTNTLVLKDGQTRDFTAAADRVSGEVVRIAVTLRVVK